MRSVHRAQPFPTMTHQDSHYYGSMEYMLDHPRILSFVCVCGMWLAALAGAWIRGVVRLPGKEVKENLNLVVSATLTLLGLIIGFTFSMATTRHDQRRLYEEGEANAIGTEYVRADLLSPAQADVMKHDLLVYLDHRIRFYQQSYGKELIHLDSQTIALQARLWKLIQPPAAAQPTPVMALVVSGMNDVLNSQSYTQFAWWNRIPTSAWLLMIIIALFANGLIGFAADSVQFRAALLFILPLIGAISFFLIADIDSPRGGIIRVPPVDLMSLSEQLHAGLHPAE